MRSFAILILAFLRRGVLQMASYRLSLLLNLGSAFFMLLVLFFLSDLVSGLGSTYLNNYGGDYFPFVVLGIAMSSLVNAGLRGFTSTISGEQAVGTLEPMLAAPAGAFRTFAAASVAQNLMTFIWPAMYVALGAIFYRGFVWAGLPELLLAVFLTSAAYFGIGMASAAFTLVFKRGNPVAMIFGGLPNLISGVWFPASLLPAWLMKAGWLLPITFGLEAARMALIPGTPGVASRTFIYTYLTIYAVSALAIGYVAFSLALKRAKKDGSLSHY